ncbi:DUF5941 domain-containing protein [Thermobifida cellulosilytica]|uniref:DUF5941 domain-containing protein n=1 Tax=Thermobifida cellulosilytica TB100 TaxID=665004 RepID=A0A147KGA8_THECS|nr:DUF5941 domain-containing protein [Thermobifida cellulosilytica]KUP96249.1 hypothetical protein AC529_13180 [Thermobifida cellulosilytica TB100]
MHPTPQSHPVDLRFLRDDGHLSTGIGTLVQGALPPVLPAFAGILVMGVLLVAGFGDLTGVTLFAPAAALLLSGVASAHPHDGRFDWVVPPLLHGAEYLYLFALGYGAGVPGPLVFALVALVVLHHGSTVLRARHGVLPPEWARWAMLGWDGRMLLVAAGGAMGWLPFAYGLLLGYLAVLFAWETATSWLAAPVTAAGDDPGDTRGGVAASDS